VQGWEQACRSRVEIGVQEVPKQTKTCTDHEDVTGWFEAAVAREEVRIYSRVCHRFGSEEMQLSK
jgi:hypothetical protein